MGKKQHNTRRLVNVQYESDDQLIWEFSCLNIDVIPKKFSLSSLTSKRVCFKCYEAETVNMNTFYTMQMEFEARHCFVLAPVWAGPQP